MLQRDLPESAPPAGRMFKRKVELMEASLGDEMVALDVEGGSCFGFNVVAASVWRQLERPQTFAALHAQLLDEFDVTAEKCARDLRRLLDELSSVGLLA